MKDGPSLGNSEGYSESRFVGVLVGTVDGMKEGSSLRNGEGERDDEIVGLSLGDSDVPLNDGRIVGILEVIFVGRVLHTDGELLGTSLTLTDG